MYKEVRRKKLKEEIDETDSSKGDSTKKIRYETVGRPITVDSHIDSQVNPEDKIGFKYQKIRPSVYGEDK
ncbi:MAG: hypothetical protein R3B60_00690 [Candidatus Paceibacterota bacterium]